MMGNRRIVFHYTPKHASWMNQIEIWFGIIIRKKSSTRQFCFTAGLEKQSQNFMDCFNETMAKPFKWTYRERR